MGTSDRVFFNLYLILCCLSCYSHLSEEGDDGHYVILSLSEVLNGKNFCHLLIRAQFLVSFFFESDLCLSNLLIVLASMRRFLN